MRIFTPELVKLHAMLVLLARQAYKSTWLVANPILARFIPAGISLQRQRRSASLLRVVFKSIFQIGKYYQNNLKSLLTVVVMCLRFPRSSLPMLHGPALLFDSDCPVQRILGSGTLDLVDLKGLVEESLERGAPLVVSPNMHGHCGLKDIPRLARIMNSQPYPVVTACSVVTALDLLHLCWFTLGYPFALAHFLLKASGAGEASQLCIETLPTPVVHSYLRYLYGRRLASLLPSGAIAISWCENRAGDKLFYRGLRRDGAGSITIIGAQLFAFPDDYIGAYLTRAETEHGLAPDRLVCNGPYFLPSESNPPATVGPSLRYDGIFAFDPKVPKQGDTILVALGYNGSYEALDILAQVNWPRDRKIMVRLHPGHAEEDMKKRLPQGFTIAQGPLHPSFHHSSLVIGVETGVMLEAVACAVPVISLNTLGDASMQHMPQEGKGVVWFPATTSDQVENLIERALAVPEGTLQNYAMRYRSQFFCKPSPGHLLEGLGIDPSLWTCPHV